MLRCKLLNYSVMFIIYSILHFLVLYISLYFYYVYIKASIKRGFRDKGKVILFLFLLFGFLDFLQKVHRYNFEVLRYTLSLKTSPQVLHFTTPYAKTSALKLNSFPSGHMRKGQF